MITPLKRRCEHVHADGIGCRDNGIREYCGYCAFHWLRLTQEQRTILLNERVKSPKLSPLVAGPTTIYNPPRSPFKDSAIIALGVFLGEMIVSLLKLKGWWP